MGYYKQKEIETMDDDGLAKEAIKKRRRFYIGRADRCDCDHGDIGADWTGFF